MRLNKINTNKYNLSIKYHSLKIYNNIFNIKKLKFLNLFTINLKVSVK